MKNFFTIVPLQADLKECNYEHVDNDKLELNETTRFPLIHIINGYVEENEEISVFAITDNSEMSKKNTVFLEEEVEKFSKIKNFKYKIDYIVISEKQNLNDHISTFQSIIEKLTINNSIYACLTYGTKPQSKALEMALNYANKCLDNNHIACIVYGQVAGSYNDNPRQGFIYDITAMTKLNDIVNALSERGVKNPGEHLKNLLNS